MKTIDCAIIGAGPAGLTAAVYLARFRRDVRLFDAGSSRAELIPVSHNYPGFADGVSGVDLLKALRRQVNGYEVPVERSAVTSLVVTGDHFTVTAGADTVRAHTVVLATGVEDLKPQHFDWHSATLSGAVRWCPVCDGYEITDRSVALMSNPQDGYRHALFLRTYTRQLAFIVEGSGPALTDVQMRSLQSLEIEVLTERVSRLSLRSKQIAIEFEHGVHRLFDSIYPMVGCAPRIGLLHALRPRLDANNLLWVDEHQCTSIPGIYAAGDVVHSLHQIAVGASHAATAATAIHRRLEANYR